ncbi:MAG: hypothetical protein PUJ43_06355 [Bacillales bacterium]|nr:hypothetical protein [Bacillales bacterium]MDY5920333.1 hypothetical protein [Candidatus Enteromonas sp.]
MKKPFGLLMLSVLALSACGTPVEEPSSSAEETSEESSLTTESEEESTPSSSESISEEESSSVEETSSEEPVNLKEKYKLRREDSLLSDSSFKNGFGLFSPETTTAHVEDRLIDYNGEAETDFYNPEADHSYYWTMCQWWTPYNFVNATYSKNGDTHIYENESRRLEVNPNEGSLHMELNADMEYEEKFGGPRDPAASWSHFLIQQNFPSELVKSPSTFEDLYVEMDVTIEESTYLGEGEPTGAECAQLLFYFCLFNRVPADSNPEEVGMNGTGMWFGVPIYDSRYDYVDRYIGGDTGFVGSTNRMIYSIASQSYMGRGPVEMNHTYKIRIDVLDLLKEAFIYGVKNDYLPNCLWNNLYLTYMNFGWELPGQYKVSSTLSNLDIHATILE